MLCIICRTIVSPPHRWTERVGLYTNYFIFWCNRSHAHKIHSLNDQNDISYFIWDEVNKGKNEKIRNYTISTNRYFLKNMGIELYIKIRFLSTWFSFIFVLNRGSIRGFSCIEDTKRNQLYFARGKLAGNLQELCANEPVIFHMISSNNQICQDKKHRLEYPYFLLSRENLHRHRCSGIGIERNGSDDESLINPLCLIKEQSLCGN